MDRTRVEPSLIRTNDRIEIAYEAVVLAYRELKDGYDKDFKVCRQLNATIETLGSCRKTLQKHGKKIGIEINQNQMASKPLKEPHDE